MKTFLFAGIVGVVLFAISAGASWYLINQSTPPALAVDEESDVESAVGVPPIGRGTEKREQLPVAIRPDGQLSVEAVLELSESIRRKERDLMEREQSVEKMEQNVKLLFEDLKVERAELTALLDGLEAKLHSAQQTISQLKQENLLLSTQTQEFTKLAQQNAAKTSGGEQDELAQRVKTAKPWFEGLDDEQAANYLKEFANNGELRFAARLLKSLPQRKASKILAAFDDPELVQQILDALASEGNGDSQRASDTSASRRSMTLPR